MYSGYVYVFACRYIFNWPHWDDFLLIQFYEQIFTAHTFTLRQFLTMRDGVQPEGVVAILSAAIFRIMGINFAALVWLNLLLVLGSALFVAATASRTLLKPISKLVVWIGVPAAMCHPFQVEQLFWASSIGWFLVTAILLLNVGIIERGGKFMIPALIVSLSIATLSAAPGSILWAAAALHLLLRDRWRGIPWAFAFSLVAVVSSVRLAVLAPTHASCTTLTTYAPFTSVRALLSYVGDIGVYFTQIVGTAFSQRDPVALLWIGGPTLTMAVGALVLVVGRRSLTSADRSGTVLVVTSLTWLAMFAEGRLPCGLPAMVWEFHMSPLVVPLLAGLVLVGVGLYDRAERPERLGWAIMLLPIVYLFASIFVSLPDATMRAGIGQMVRAEGKHAVCTGGSRYLVENANIAGGFYDEIMHDAPLLRHLCSAVEPAEAQLLEQFPPLFAAIVAADPTADAPLHDLWELYETHIDLLRAYPIASPETPLAVLRWGRWQAGSGIPYDPAKLARHQEFFKNLKLE